MQLESKIREFSALRYFNFIAPATVVAWAENVWEQGDVPNGVAKLAELREARAHDVDAQIAEIRHELGLPPISAEIAGLELAVGAVGDFCDNKLSEIDAARRLWHIATLDPTLEVKLNVFIGLTSEWDDDVAHRAEYERDIRLALSNLRKELSK